MKYLKLCQWLENNNEETFTFLPPPNACQNLTHATVLSDLRQSTAAFSQIDEERLLLATATELLRKCRRPIPIEIVCSFIPAELTFGKQNQYGGERCSIHQLTSR
jgi:hypothetical protein